MTAFPVNEKTWKTGKKKLATEMCWKSTGKVKIENWELCLFVAAVLKTQNLFMNVHLLPEVH